MTSDYLHSAYALSQNGAVDFCTSSNYDEAYRYVYPRLDKKTMLNLLAQYPDPNFEALKKAICSKYFVKSPVLGAGSEDLIVRLNQVIKASNWTVGVVWPTFYRITDGLTDYQKINSSQINGGRLNKADVVWISNPNPLTGEIFEKTTLKRIIKNNPRTFFLIDEAGMFILNNWQRRTLLRESAILDNLVVVSSFSKAFGLSGLRAGFATGNLEILKQVERLGPTFPIDAIATYILQKVISNDSFLTEMKRRVYRHKKRIGQLLRRKNMKIKLSVNNCIYFKSPQKGLVDRLLSLKIIALDLSGEPGTGQDGYVRLTIHSSPKRYQFLRKALQKL